MQRIKQTLARLTSSSRSSKSAKNIQARKAADDRRKSVNISRAGSKSEGSLYATTTTETLAQFEDLDLSESSRGPCFLLGGSNDEPDGVDIVLVHGFQGHRVGSWTKAGVCWPRDLLGQDIAGARVISWGWSVSAKDAAVFSKLAEQSSFGDLFLSEIVNFRKEKSSKRPLIFIGHDFGGVIIKQALATAAMSRIYGNGIRSELGDVYAKTIGVIFLGTPHVSDVGKSLGETLAAAAYVAPQAPDPALVGWLKSQSEVFIKIHEDFVLFTRDTPVVCIREERPTPDGMRIPRASSTYDGGMDITNDSIHADHFDMARFARRTDPGFLQILGHISKLSRGPALSDIEETREKRNQEILNALCFEGMMEKEGRIKVEDTFRDTCSQVLAAKGPEDSASPFHEWLLSKESIFWMSGRAESGKSTLMKYAFHDQETRKRLDEWAKGGKLMMASVYLDDGGSHLQRSHECILRTVLYQILSYRRDLIIAAFPSFFVGPWPPLSPLNTIVNLTQAFWGIFSQEADRLRLVIFIDGLDAYRCEERDGRPEGRLDSSTPDPGNGDSDSYSDSAEEAARHPGRRQWLEDSYREIAGLVNFMSDQAFTKFCVSSRELKVFEEAFGQRKRLRVHTQSEEAIASYCVTRLKEEAPYLGDARALCLEVAVKSNGHVLYARLAMDLLLEGSLRAIRATLNSLPDRVGGSKGLYMHILQRLEKGQRRDAARIFQLMSKAQQPLPIITLRFAEEGYLNETGGLRAVDQGAQTITLEELKDIYAEMKQHLETCCLHLIQCEGESPHLASRAVFTHKSVKDFAGRADVWDKLIGQPNACSSLDVDLRLLSGYIRHIQVFPSIRLFVLVYPGRRTRIQPEAWLLISIALRYASRIESQLKGDAVRTTHYIELLDELDSACQHAWVTTLQTYQPLFEDMDWTETQCPALCRSHWAGYEPMETGKAAKRTDFLSLAIQANLVNYVSLRIGSFLRGDDEATRLAKLQRLLYIAVCPKTDGVSTSAEHMSDYRDLHRDMPDTAFLDILFHHGLVVSDASGSKIWAKAVRNGSQYFSRRARAHLNQLMKTDLKSVANPNNHLALENNRSRWAAAMKKLLAHGADPDMPIDIVGSSLRDDGSSTEARTAIEFIRDLLHGEPESFEFKQ